MAFYLQFYMLLNIYKVNKELPEHITFEVLNCERIWDIPPGIYKFDKFIRIDYKTCDELIEAIELKILNFEVPDIIEIVPDVGELSFVKDYDKENECNFIIITDLGCKQIALEKEEIFKNISLDCLYELFA